TTMCVDLAFFEKVVVFAREHRLMVVHDFAYADFAFDGYQPPSFLQVRGAKDVGVEIFSLSKSYNMPGWRMGFVCGNSRMIHALARIKSYLDYGAFQPIQIASIIALEGDQSVVTDIVEVHRRRRDVLVTGLNKLGWNVPKPKGTMFVCAPIPEDFRAMGSLEFSKLLIQEAKVAVSPGIGFGEYGEGFVRFALVENEQRIRQALRGVKRLGRWSHRRESRPHREGRAGRQPGPLRLRHRQRDLQLHLVEDDGRRARLRGRPQGSPGARLRRGRSDARHRGPGLGPQAADPGHAGLPHVRRSEGHPHRRHHARDPAGHRLRARARLPGEAPRDRQGQRWR